MTNRRGYSGADVSAFPVEKSFSLLREPSPLIRNRGGIFFFEAGGELA